SCDPSTAMAAVNILYDTGARDESPELTGIAHLFEHLMFGGSANVKDYSGEIEAAGGTDNAWTSNDFTNFYEVLPAQNIETAFWLESDRMLAPNLDEKTLSVQRQVVIEEFKQQCLNRPYGDMAHYLRRMLYGDSHPYAWPVIGKKPEHVAAVTADDARRWFYDHYGPDNAVLAVSGNVTFDEVKRLAEKWFGPIPRRNIAQRRLASPHFPTADVVEHVKSDVPQTAVTIAYPMAAYGERDYYVADTITDLLSAGRSSRFYRRLLMGGGGLFSEVDASIIGSEHEGFLMLNAKLTDDSDEAVDRAIAMMKSEASALCEKDGVSDYELQRCMNRFESTFNFSNMGYQMRAANLAMAVYHGEDINATVARQRATTCADVRRVAQQLFMHTPSATLIYEKLNG
ncbi:MAG: insulinase family protein, partial [Muribaculaceae bacterium]|nr:insulinase family protein [Muribaculaceae bacterium]